MIHLFNHTPFKGHLDNFQTFLTKGIACRGLSLKTIILVVEDKNWTDMGVRIKKRRQIGGHFNNRREMSAGTKEVAVRMERR